MALPWWLRGGLTGGAALLKEHLKKKGKELVGEARKKAIAKLAKKQKNGKKEKKKGKKSGELDKSVPIKKLIKTADKIKKERNTDLIDSTHEEMIAAARKLYDPKTPASIKRFRKAKAVWDRRKAIAEQDSETTSGTGRSPHSITGRIKGDRDLTEFTDQIILHDSEVAKNVKRLQELKKHRDFTKRMPVLNEYNEKMTRLMKRNIDPKLRKQAEEEFDRIQKKKDRFTKKDAKKKGKQGD
jgi:hypothetical protein